MRICLTCVTSLLNRGVEALVASMATELRETFPGCMIDVLTHEEEVNEPFLERLGLTAVSDLYAREKYAFLDRFGTLGRLVRGLTPYGRRCARLDERLRGYDLVIATGGDNFSSDYGSPAVFLRPLAAAQKGGVPVAFIGQSIGPFREREHAEAFLSVARGATLITVREKQSYEYVTKTLGLGPDIVATTADVAFLLQPAAPDLVDRMMRNYGFDPDRKKIALAISQGITHFAQGDEAAHLDALENLCCHVLKETGAQIALVAHVEDYRPHNNDLILADKLLRRLNHDPDVILVRAFHDASEYKGIIGRCDMVVAERMHAAIAGLSSGVPAFVIGYSVKGRGILSDVFEADAAEKGYVVPIQQFIDGSRGLTEVMSIWNARADLAEQLRDRIPALKAAAAANFTMLLEIVARPS